MKIVLDKPDSYGALASALCMVHCFATPLLFVVHASSEIGHGATPTWWRSLDYIFLTVSFFAVYRSVQTTAKEIMKNLLWITWIALFVVIMNEKLELFHISELITYVITGALIVLHVYNLKYCQCKNEKCCTQ